MVDHDVLETLLIDAARKQEPLTYGDVLSFFERRVTPITVNALCRDLGVVCDRLRSRNAPELACLVVRRSDRIPGAGYFTSYRFSGDYKGPSTGPEAEAFVAERQAFAYRWVEQHGG